MTVAAIREKLMIYLANADDKKVKALYTLLEDNMEDHNSFTLTQDHIDILDRERELHFSGKSKSYGLGEAQQIIRGEKAIQMSNCETDSGADGYIAGETTKR